MVGYESRPQVPADLCRTRDRDHHRHHLDRGQYLTERVVSSTGGEKETKLARFDLIPVHPLEQLAKLYGVGAQKYAERNWEKGIKYGLLFTAACRHMWAWWRGEEYDQEMSVLADEPISHLTCAVWHLFALTDYRCRAV